MNFPGNTQFTDCRHWRKANPEMTFLEKAEIEKLLNVLAGDDLLVALLCLSTGGRWTEVATLKPAQITNCRVTFLKTKNGKKRTVPISEELEKKLKRRPAPNYSKLIMRNFAGFYAE